MEKKFWIITYIITLFLLTIKINVYANTCESGQVATQYLNNNSYTSYSIGTQVQTTSFRRLYTGVMSNVNVDYTFRAIIFAPLRQVIEPTYTIEGRVGTGANYTNIGPYCNMQYIEDYIKNDNTILQTYWTIVVKCNIPSTDANYSRIRLTINQPNLIKMTDIEECTKIDKEPQENEEQLNQIEKDMYNYYSSIWEKSNISEEIILNRIQEAEQNIIEELQVNPNGQFTTNNIKANQIEQKEGELKESLNQQTIPFNKEELFIGKWNTEEYQNSRNIIWRIINGTIGNYSWLWPLTALLLTLGLIKLLLSR